MSKSIFVLFFILSIFDNNLNKEITEAPNFSMVDLAGQEIELKDLRGKVVYLSFWASWCGPCIRGFNKYDDTRRQLEDLGVVILNVSIDSNKEAWRKGLKTIPDTGKNFFASDQSNLKLDYEISSIPLYHIIDKYGHFRYLSDDIDRDIIAEFTKLTKE